MTSDISGLLGVARVEGRLAAAGLFGPELAVAAHAFQHVRHGEADFGEKLVDQASHE
jgi:hypothetical protein